MPKSADSTPHLWVIITEPDENGDVVIVNVTSWRPDSDETVIIKTGEHHRITHQSVVFYQDARIAKAALIEKAIQNTTLCVKCDPCSQELLMRIQQGVTQSRFTPRKVKDFCQKSWAQNPPKDE